MRAMLKRYKYEIVGEVQVLARSEEQAQNSVIEILGSAPQEYVGDLLKVEELPTCKMSLECQLWRKDWAEFSEEAREKNPAGCMYYEEGLCTI